MSLYYGGTQHSSLRMYSIMGCHQNQISVDTTLRLIADEERRRVLAKLVDHPDDVVSVEELVDQMTVLSPGGVAATETDRGRSKLKHDILPRLDDTNVVEYDWRSEAVRYRPNDRLERLLGVVRTDLE